MPIYEYQCNDCGKISEILTKMNSHDEVPKCKGCGSTNLEKLMSISFATTRHADHASGTTCCGKSERCDMPPCSGGGVCRRD